MKNSTILLLVILSSVMVAVTQGLGPAQLIDENCKLASSFDKRFPPQYCVSMINTAPYDRQAPNMSARRLARISLKIMALHVNATRDKVLQLNGPGQGNPVMRDALQRCISSYNEAFHRNKKGIKLFSEQQFAEADRTVSMIQGDGSDCETQFTSRNLPSPITKENLDTQFLSAMSCLFIRFFDKTYTPSGLLNLNKPH